MTATASPYWAVAAVQTNRADLVQEHLKRGGFETFNPKIRMPQKRVAPLFPGYVLVRIIVRWYPVRWTPGVLRVLMDGERPAHLPDHIVTEIRSREVRGFVKLPKEPGALEIGQAVRIKTGLFMGEHAIYQGQPSQDREKVLLSWLGQSVTALLPRGSVEALA